MSERCVCEEVGMKGCHNDFPKLLRRLFVAVRSSVHRILFAGELAQEIAHNPRVFVRLLLHLALADGVERTEKPHLL